MNSPALNRFADDSDANGHTIMRPISHDVNAVLQRAAVHRATPSAGRVAAAPVEVPPRREATKDEVALVALRLLESRLGVEQGAALSLEPRPLPARSKRSPLVGVLLACTAALSVTSAGVAAAILMRPSALAAAGVGMAALEAAPSPGQVWLPPLATLETPALPDNLEIEKEVRPSFAGRAVVPSRAVSAALPAAPAVVRPAARPSVAAPSTPAPTSPATGAAEVEPTFRLP